MVIPSLIGKRVYIDASALIYAIEVPQQYQGLRSKVFNPFSLGQLTLVTSWITFAEVLVRPMQIGDALFENTYRQFFKASHVLKSCLSTKRCQMTLRDSALCMGSNYRMLST